MPFDAKEPGKIFFFDFDNTIAKVDVLDAIIEKFSVDREWEKFEEEWKAGKIGSKVCLESQLKSVRVRREDLVRYLGTVRIDPCFITFYRKLKQKNIPCLVVSDSFTFIIETILRHYGIDDLPVRANELQFQGDRLIPSFPYQSRDCVRCAHCKKRHVLEHSDKTTLYVGDGLSDLCPALQSEYVFAKGTLLKLLRERGKDCTAFDHFGEVAARYRIMEAGNKKPKSLVAV